MCNGTRACNNLAIVTAGTGNGVCFRLVADLGAGYPWKRLRYVQDR
jgi:hypothetical protein